MPRSDGTAGPLAGGVLLIDLEALAENYRRLRAAAAPAECAAVVKANAYGLGIERVAPALSAAGCRTFFVATLEEGERLRRTLAPARSARTRVFVLSGVAASLRRRVERAHLIPVLNTPGDIAAWSATTGRHANVAIHLDTGMNRLGLSEAEVAAVAPSLARLDVALVLSHLACSEEKDNPMNRRQLERFGAMRQTLATAAPASLANSSGVFLGAEFVLDLVRPGVALYGVNPLPGHRNPMREVFQLKGKILQVRRVDRGMTVGYGATYRARGERLIATVGVGYADGYPRGLGNRGFGSIGGTRVPIAGRVSMDLTTFDVTEVPARLAQPGCLVDLIGGGAPIDDVADAADTIPYEILTRLGARFERRYRSARRAGRRVAVRPRA